jgi:hypothetical protein
MSAPRLEWRGQDGQDETQKPDHAASIGDSITSSTRIRSSAHTASGLDLRKQLQGHVDSVARGIVVPNTSPGNGGLASVNPIFALVRLAQRVPVRVHRIPPDVRLVVGMAATVEIEPKTRKPSEASTIPSENIS